MKNRWIMFLGIFSLLLAGCLDMQEDVNIRDDGSGTYATHVDMGQLFQMIQMMAGEDSTLQAIKDKPVDTTFELAAYADTARNLTPPQRELMKTGVMHLQMNMKESIFKIDMNFAFKNYIQLKDLMTGMGGQSTGMSQVMKGLFGGSNADSNSLDAARDPGLDQLNDVYNVTVSNGLISKQIDTVKLKALMARPEMQQMQNLAGSGMEMQYTTSFHLPRPVKTLDSKIAQLSDDKKTVTLKYNLLDLFDHPERFSYRIEF